MTPVAKTGLHCGWWLVGTVVVASVVTPVAKTGLHCGEALRELSTVMVGNVTPVAKTGLHCGGDVIVTSYEGFVV